MSQKRSCIFRHFYDMVKILVITYKMLMFLPIFETLFKNVITILPTTYQNNTKIPGKDRKCLVYL